MKKYRLERIEMEISRALSKALYEDTNNPKIKGIISVRRVNVTPDLKNATVYVSVLATADVKSETVVEGLNEERSYFRRRVGEEVMLRNVPELRIKLDESIEYGVKISKIINELK